MARESADERRKRADEVIRRLREHIPEARCALHHTNDFQLLVAVILSAQCTDERVNKVTPALFQTVKGPADVLKLGAAKLEKAIGSINFFRTKAKNILGAAQMLMDQHGGKVPANLDDLTALPGVGRKTANVVLGEIFAVPGIVVDTHVRRVTNRLRLTKELEPVDIERDLEKVLARDAWIISSHLFILHGRQTCNARKPLCGECVLRRLCPSRDLDPDAWK